MSHGHVVILFLHEMVLQTFTACHTLKSHMLVIATSSETRRQEVITQFSLLDELLLLGDNFGSTAFILLSILFAQVEKLHCPNMICCLFLILKSLTLLTSVSSEIFLVVFISNHVKCFSIKI